MRILHLSHGGLPDIRIERTANTMKKDGHELVFLGARKAVRQSLEAFDRSYTLELGNDLNIVFNPLMISKWLSTIEKISPDIVHAHDVLAVRFALKTDYPVVYDDHEYWSQQIPYYTRKTRFQALASKPLILMIPKWESEALRRYPTITVSEMNARDHRKKSAWVGVTLNVPTMSEIEKVPQNRNRSGAVYVGNDFNTPGFYFLRDMSGLRDVLTFDVITGLPHEEMMKRLTAYRVGLTPWKPVPLHKYCGPNKNYEYLHAGLQIVTNRLIAKSLKGNPYVHPFEDYSGIAATVESLPSADPDDIMDYARENYVWEKREKVIHEAYKRA